MYPQRISQSIVSSQPNLKNLLLEHRHYFFKYSLMIRQRFQDLKSLKDVNKKLQEIIKNGKFYKLITECSKSKDSHNILKVWVHHCECVFAQRLRRCHQMFSLYSKWWDEKAFNELLKKMKQSLTRKGKEFALGAIGVSVYDWKENRIPEEDIKNHSNELEYIDTLKDNTICMACDSTNKNNPSYSSSKAVCKCGTLQLNKTYDNWTLFIKQDDLIVWKRLHSSGQYEYKVYGSYYDVSAEDFLNVQIDTDYRRKWDTTAIVLEVAETDTSPNSNSDVIYWEMLWPRLFVNRDYVFNRRYLVDKENQLIYIVSKSTEHPNFPKYPEKYRIEDYYSCMVIKPYTEMSKPGIEFSLSYFDNPGVNIPSSKPQKKYRDYCKAEGVSKACKILKEGEKRKEEQAQKDKLEYCVFRRMENNKLKIFSPKIENDTKSDKYDLNSGNVKIIDTPSDIISTATPIADQTEHGSFLEVFTSYTAPGSIFFMDNLYYVQ
ncbi:hypothetical protein NQ317_003593 [Molorchus minor]|uniref:START domain-containing protein n=1 Tax=Molorchus minor TaxID=1323400 RepID=A0ABQ9JFC2_9CUCU|nr:hypothetical protein NQ317_003593 [Molorchus minor]